MDAASRYIDLLRLSVGEALHPAQSALVTTGSEHPSRGTGVASWLRYGGQRLLSLKGYELARRIDIPPSFVTDGRYDNGVPFSGETMIGLKRLDNVRRCVERIIEDEVPGNLITGCGVEAARSLCVEPWLHMGSVTRRCGSPTHSQAFLNQMRHVIRWTSSATFTTKLGWQSAEKTLRPISSDTGSSITKFVFIEGWFEQTLPTLAGHSWSLIRLDGDLYQSTMEGLENLYPGLSLGGYCIVDDYGTYPACRQAVEDFRERHKIDEEIVDIDGYGAFWKRTAEPATGGEVGPGHDAWEPCPEVTALSGKPLERSTPRASGEPA